MIRILILLLTIASPTIASDMGIKLTSDAIHFEIPVPSRKISYSGNNLYVTVPKVNHKKIKVTGTNPLILNSKISSTGTKTVIHFNAKKPVRTFAKKLRSEKQGSGMILWFPGERKTVELAQILDVPVTKKEVKPEENIPEVTKAIVAPTEKHTVPVDEKISDDSSLNKLRQQLLAQRTDTEKLPKDTKGDKILTAKVESSPNVDLNRYITGLVIFFGLLGCFALVAPKLKNKINQTAPTDEFAINVLSTKSVGPKQKLMTVEIAGEKFLLSQSPVGTELLSQLGMQQIFQQGFAKEGLFGDNVESLMRESKTSKKTSTTASVAAKPPKTFQDALKQSADSGLNGIVNRLQSQIKTLHV